MNDVDTTTLLSFTKPGIKKIKTFAKTKNAAILLTKVFFFLYLENMVIFHTNMLFMHIKGLLFFNKLIYLNFFSQFCPGWVVQLVGAWSLTPQGCGFHPGCKGGNQLMFLSHTEASLSLPLPSSLSKISKHIFGWRLNFFLSFNFWYAKYQ